MAVYESHFKELGFYVKGTFRKFKDGRYVSDSKDEMVALEKLSDVRKVEDQTEEEAPAPKPKRKAPAKSSKK